MCELTRNTNSKLVRVERSTTQTAMAPHAIDGNACGTAPRPKKSGPTYGGYNNNILNAVPKRQGLCSNVGTPLEHHALTPLLDDC
jgi:hypothetical protein